MRKTIEMILGKLCLVTTDAVKNRVRYTPIVSYGVTGFFAEVNGRLYRRNDDGSLEEVK